ncbi:MAG: hypothetical protein QME35_03025 [Thermoanaerobacteraceae bacterium]|nr:hypothetical protein [Thermoanaerobacteraceae bacterium]
MKKIISFVLMILMLFSSAYASVSPVPDSSPQSSNWLQYEKAEGKGVSGASIMKDNPQNEGLNSKWIHGEGDTSTSHTVNVPSVTWVQSSEQITVTDQPGYYKTVTDQPGYYKTVTDQQGYWKTVTDQQGYWKTVTDGERFYFSRQACRWDWVPLGYDGYYFDEPAGTNIEDAIWDFVNTGRALQFPSWYPYPFNLNQAIVHNLTFGYTKYIPEYDCFGFTGKYYPLSATRIYCYLDSKSYSYWVDREPDQVVNIFYGIHDPQPITHQEWVPPVTHQEWVPPVTHQEWVPPVTHVETKDTSHWITTYTTQTVQDYKYVKSPHWSPYEGYIPQYDLKKEGDLQ